MAMFSLHMLHIVLLTGLRTLSAVEGEAVATPFVEYPGNVKFPAEVVGVAGPLSDTSSLATAIRMYTYTCTLGIPMQALST